MNAQALQLSPPPAAAPSPSGTVRGAAGSARGAAPYLWQARLLQPACAPVLTALQRAGRR